MCGEIFAEFGEKTQGSGNISYGLRTSNGERYFVKTAGLPDDTRWTLTYPERIAALRNAARISRLVPYPALPRLANVIESAQGPILVYEWRTGEILGMSREERERPTSAYQRFRHLPADEIAAALDAVFAVHATLGAHDYIAYDFYDGSLLYDFAERRLTLFDLDYYRQGAFTNTMGRMFGSTRFMAPEEFERDAAIDQRTTVFTMGRLLATFLGDGTLAREPFRGTDAQHRVMCRACEPKPADRYPSVSEFYRDWPAPSVTGAGRN
jgi:serine/threonine-protein kinase